MPATFGEHLKAIKAEFGDHPNIEVVCKVLELCVLFEDLGNPGRFTESTLLMGAQFRNSLDQLVAISDPAIRKGLMRAFLDETNWKALLPFTSYRSGYDAHVRSLIKFSYEKAQQVFNYNNIDSLMTEFETKYNGKLSMPAVFEFFADKVDSQEAVIWDSDGHVKPLTWAMIKEHLKNVFKDEPIDKDWLLYYCDIEQPTKTLATKGWYIFRFNEEKFAKQYLSYIRSVLPEHAADLAKASVKYIQGSIDWQFKLTPQQLFKFNQVLFVNDIVGPPQAERSPLAKQDVLIKSIRWDNDCFIEEFLDDATRDPLQDEPEQEQPKVRPRPDPHRQYTVTVNGVVKRKEKKPSTYGITDQEELKRKKAERSPPQSTTLVTPDKQSAVFGYGTSRRSKLVGFISPAADALLKLLLLYDRGTIDRPYEFDDEKAAERFFAEKVQGKFPFMFADIEEFKKAIKTGELNEVIARLRWLAGSSAVGVFADTFEARCVAQYYARLVRMKTKKPDDFPVPIVYYLPYYAVKHWSYYTEEQQRQDKVEAENIMTDEVSVKTAISGNNHFEFLLLLSDPLSALRTKIDDKTIFERLKEKKDYHLIHALFKIILSSSEDKTLDLKDLKIDYPTMAYFIKRGDKKVVKYCFAHGLFHIKRKEIPQDPKNNLLLLACKRGWEDVAQGLVRSSIECDIKELGVHLNEVDDILYWILQQFPHGSSWFGVDLAAAGETPLMTAVMARRPNVARALLRDESIDPNTTKDGNTPLLAAVSLGDIEMTTLLLDDERVDYTCRNNQGHNALQLALRSENCALITAILNHKRVGYDADSWYLAMNGYWYSGRVGLVKDASSTGNLDVYLTVARALVQKYITKLEQRTEEYAPRGKFIATLFGYTGFSKNEKLAAARSFLQLLNGEAVTLTEQQRDALENGALSEIVDVLISIPLAVPGSSIYDFIVNLRKQIYDNPPASVEEAPLLQQEIGPSPL